MTKDDLNTEVPSTPNSKRNVIDNKQGTQEVKNKLRILCLHGYRQNADAFKRKLGSFRKMVGQYAEFVFLDAPHSAAPLDKNGDPLEEQRSWWFNKDDGTFKGTNKGGPAFGFQESLKLVEQAWLEQGPLDGLLGFSQGACFVGILCGLSKKNMTSVKPSFAIMASGFVSGSLVHKCAYEDVITIPTLHIYGTGDEIIPPAMCGDMLKHFKNAKVVEHSGGHYFAANKQQKEAYVQFMQRRQVGHLEELHQDTSGSEDQVTLE